MFHKLQDRIEWQSKSQTEKLYHYYSELLNSLQKLIEEVETFPLENEGDRWERFKLFRKETDNSRFEAFMFCDIEEWGEESKYKNIYNELNNKLQAKLRGIFPAIDKNLQEVAGDKKKEKLLKELLEQASALSDKISFALRSIISQVVYFENTILEDFKGDLEKLTTIKSLWDQVNRANDKVYDKLNGLDDKARIQILEWSFDFTILGLVAGLLSARDVNSLHAFKRRIEDLKELENVEGKSEAQLKADKLKKHIASQALYSKDNFNVDFLREKMSDLLLLISYADNRMNMKTGKTYGEEHRINTILEKEGGYRAKVEEKIEKIKNQFFALEQEIVKSKTKMKKRETVDERHKVLKPKKAVPRRTISEITFFGGENPEQTSTVLSPHQEKKEKGNTNLAASLEPAVTFNIFDTNQPTVLSRKFVSASKTKKRTNRKQKRFFREIEVLPETTTPLTEVPPEKKDTSPRKSLV